MNIDYIKATFGYIGFVPFAILAIIPWIFGESIAQTAIIFQIAYGSIILRSEDYKHFRKMLSLLVSISFLISSAYWINPYSNPLNF